MQITEANAEGLKHELTVVVDATDIEKRVQTRLNEIGRTIKLPGFRPGKVPMGLLRKRYGQSVMGEVIDRAVNDSSSEAMRERNLRPALQPKVEILSFKEGKDLEYKIAVEVLPDIQPTNFAELALERLKPEVPDAEIDEALRRIAKQQRKSEKVERAAETGDTVLIDFVGTVDGAAFPGGTAKDYTLELGSGSFIPGFEEQLAGAAAGEERKVDVTFPADYGSEDLAGKSASFAVTVKEVRALTPQPIDESLAEAVGMENLEALRTAVRERMERDYSGLARQKLKRDLLDKLAERHDFPVPEGMVDIEFQSIWEQLEAERKRVADAAAAPSVETAGSGETGGEDALIEVPAAEAAAPAADAPATIEMDTPSDQAPADAEPVDDEKLKAEYRAIAERRVRLGLLLAEVGRSNNITVGQDEVNRAVGEAARRFPGQEREVVEYYRSNQEALDGLRAPIYEDKVVDFILELAQVTERSVPPAELIAAEEDNEDEPAA